MSRVVVVGAGVGGLAAAARLGAQGHDVVVCEAASGPGGKLGLLEQQVPGAGTFRFDTGPSLVTLPQVLRDLFAATGGWPRGLDLVPLDPVARYRFADGTGFDASSDLDEHCARLDAWSPGAGRDWRALSARAERVWTASRGPFLESPLSGPGAVARLALRQPGDLAAIAPHRTLRGLGRRYLHDPRLRMVLDRYATYTGSDPRRTPAALAAVPHAEQAYGGWYVPGGLHRIALALDVRARERGARLRYGARVARVETAGGRVSGVRLADGERLPADVVVANADAAHVYGDLVHSPAAARRLARATPSLSGFVLLLAVRGRTPGLAHHQVLFPADYDAEFDAVFGSRSAPARPVPDPTLYVSAPDDPAVRPEGHEAWFVLVNAPRHAPGAARHAPGAVRAAHGSVDWREPGLAEAYADRLVDLLGRRGLPVADRVLARTVLTPADLEQRTGALGGAIYGTSSNGPAAAFLRPANASPVRGLFLVGGSSHPGGGLPLVALSARIVADLVGPA